MIGSSKVVGRGGGWFILELFPRFTFKEASEDPYTDYYIWRDAKDLDPSKSDIDNDIMIKTYFSFDPK